MTRIDPDFSEGSLAEVLKLEKRDCYFLHGLRPCHESHGFDLNPRGVFLR